MVAWVRRTAAEAASKWTSGSHCVSLAKLRNELGCTMRRTSTLCLGMAGLMLSWSQPSSHYLASPTKIVFLLPLLPLLPLSSFGFYALASLPREEWWMISFLVFWLAIRVPRET